MQTTESQVLMYTCRRDILFGLALVGILCCKEYSDSGVVVTALGCLKGHRSLNIRKGRGRADLAWRACRTRKRNG